MVPRCTVDAKVMSAHWDTMRSTISYLIQPLIYSIETSIYILLGARDRVMDLDITFIP